jgi:hypothetical protein
MTHRVFEQTEVVEAQSELNASDQTPLAKLTPGEVLLGTLIAIDGNGSPIIKFPQFPHVQPTTALATVPVLPQHLGRQVAVLFTQGNDAQPIVMGFIYSPLQHMLDNFSEPTFTSNAEPYEQDQAIFEQSLPPIDNDNNPQKLDVETVHVDGKKVLIEGREEVVLKCGEASITLTSIGKVVIRGKYLVSRSSGVNRILGGSVQVN